MPRLLHMTLAAALLFGACSSPGDDPVPGRDAGNDVSVDADIALDMSDASTTPDASDVPFDFGFDSVPFDAGLSGLQPATVVWNGVERSARLFLFGSLGTLTFEADGRRYTYRLEADVGFLSGEIHLALTERSCSADDGSCEPIPEVLRESTVYDAFGRHDGEQVIFAPLTVRPEALTLAPDFEFVPPLDPRITPNDGFKPAQVPDAAGNWVGQISFVSGGQALSGADSCTIVIDQIGADYEIISMDCGSTSYALDADPGPDSTSLEVDTTNWIVAFDFVDGPNRYTLGGLVDVGTWAGVIVESSRYDELGSPVDAEVGDVEGLFYFDDRL